MVTFHAGDCSVTGSIEEDNNNRSTRMQYKTTTTDMTYMRMIIGQHKCVINILHHIVTSYIHA